MSFRQGARQFFERRGAPPPPIPYDAEVEYLECTGDGAYIDTGIIISDNNFLLTCDMNATTPAQTAWSRFFGSYTSEPAMSTRMLNFSTNSNNIYVGYRRASNAQAGINTLTRWGSMEERAVYRLSYMNLKVLKSGVIVSDIGLAGNSGSEDTSTVSLFGSRMICYSFSIEHSGSMTIDFIPVRVGTEGAMYDRVSGQLFRNAGTGAFLYGPDKS